MHIFGKWGGGGGGGGTGACRLHPYVLWLGQLPHKPQGTALFADSLSSRKQGQRKFGAAWRSLPSVTDTERFH